MGWREQCFREKDAQNSVQMRKGRCGQRRWVALGDEDYLSLTPSRCHRSSGALQGKTLPLSFAIGAELFMMVTGNVILSSCGVGSQNGHSR